MAIAMRGEVAGQPFLVLVDVLLAAKPCEKTVKIHVSHHNCCTNHSPLIG
jgi:hypothetical protein